MVNFQKRAANLAGDNTNIEASDYTKDAIIDRLLVGRMLVEEAESRGVAATKAEMEDNLSSLKASYNDYPEVKKQVDEYCSGAGLSTGRKTGRRFMTSRMTRYRRTISPQSCSARISARKQAMTAALTMR